MLHFFEKKKANNVYKKKMGLLYPCFAIRDHMSSEGGKKRGLPMGHLCFATQCKASGMVGGHIKLKFKLEGERIRAWLVWRFIWVEDLLCSNHNNPNIKCTKMYILYMPQFISSFRSRGEITSFKTVRRVTSSPHHRWGRGRDQLL